MTVYERPSVRRECQYRLHTVEPPARPGAAQAERGKATPAMQARTTERNVIAAFTARQKL
jgi:hypothetical protein